MGILNDAMDYLGDKTGTPIVSFTGTRGAGLTAGDCYGIYDKWTNTVRLYIVGSKSTNGSTGEILFTIPSSYRPSSSVSGGAIFGAMVSGTIQTTAGSVTINTSGQITQGATGYLRAIYSVIEYSL